MRIAVLADIHGNLPAFETALTHLRRHAPDLLVIAGDIVVGSPDSYACWQLVQSLDCPIVRGNHERYLSHFGTEQADPLWLTEQFLPVQWAVQQFRDDERQAIAQLPLALRLVEAPDLLIVHASEVSDTTSLPLHTTSAKLTEIFGDASEQTIVRGHNHIPRTHPWGRRQIVTTGSVGLPLEGRIAAQYVLLDQGGDGWEAHHQSVAYPVEQTLQRFAETDYVAQTGPMGRLFQREVATASYHFVPFLRYYKAWREEEPGLALGVALERFLTHF
ncbi:MAG: metallophosphoesterase family protein [Caldilineaceae bacterium]|nr:metallophosphoesterase family protein [Caldilineaceae bacterium]